MAAAGLAAGSAVALDVAPVVGASSVQSQPDCTIVGTAGPDVLGGTSGRDVICGLGGDDVLRGNGGDDVLRGGDGDDLLLGGAGADELRAGYGQDTLRGGIGADALYGLAGDERLLGGGGPDALYGGRQADDMSGGAGADSLNGDRGDDALRGGAGADLLFGADGDDELLGGADDDVVLGADGDDHLVGAGGDDTLRGRLGDDVIEGGGGADRITGAEGADQLDGGDGADVVTGGDGDDAMLGGAGDDVLRGRFDPTFSDTIGCGDGAGDEAYVDTADVVDADCELTHSPGGEPPVAVDDAETVTEDDPATAVDVLANDTDADGGAMAVGSVTQPGHGTVAVTGGGTGLTYEPDADYCNDAPVDPTDDFTYTLAPGGSTGSVAVTVTCVDDAPATAADAATVAEDDPATTIDVLANDGDADGDPFSIDSVTQPANGTVVITNAGADLTYAPDPDYCNAPPGTTPDPFTYTVLPGGDTATVDVTVTCVDDAPVAVDDTTTVTEDDPATAVDVLGNDTDVDGGGRTIDSVTQPVDGTVAITNGGADLTYAPDPDYCNDPPGTPDSFTYTLAPGADTATVDVTVTCVTDPAVAADDPATIAEDDPATTIDVLANDAVGDTGPISITSVTQPADGTVVITNAGADLTYQPDANYCNTPPGTTTDDFTYTLTPDGDTATVAVTVTCASDAPIAVDDTATVTEDDPATTIDVLGNDSDADGDPFGIDSVTQPANGTVVITNAGADLTYEPDPSYCNDPPGTTPDSFTYTLTPGGDTATVDVTVTCVIVPAAAADDVTTVAEDAAATTIDVLANDTTGTTGPISVTSVTQPANGTVVITNAGADLTYQPDPNYCNDPPGTTDDFTYTLTPDGDTATVSVSVTCVNDAPVADDESFTAADAAVGNTVLVMNDPTDAAPAESGIHKSVTGDLLAGDTDVETPGALTITGETVATADGGSVTIEADGDFVYTPKAGTSCTDHSDSFGYTLNDGDGGTGVGTVTIETNGCVWYVSNNAAGNSGTSDAPFDTLALAEGASAMNDTIYVFDGDDTTTGYGAGITLKTNQRLVGEASALDVGADHLADAVPANRPTLTASGTDVVSLASGNIVTGLTVDPNGAGGIAGGAGDAGGTITDVQITDGGTAGTQPGLELDGTSGSFAVSSLTVSTSGATGIRLNNAGTVGFAAVGTIAVTSSGAKALDLTGTNLGTSVFDSVTVTGSSAGGVSATNTTGTLTFGDLSLTTTSGATGAFVLSNAAGVTVPASGSATVSATGGPAVEVSGPGAVLSFDTVSSTNSASRGVNLQSLGAGTFQADGGTIIGNQVGPAFEVQGGSGDVTYAGPIQDGTGSLSVAVISRTGGTVTFSGSVTDSNDGGGGVLVQGNSGGSTVFSGATKTFHSGNQTTANVSMTNSDGHTLRFTGGGLSITAANNNAAGFQAHDSGTVVVTGPGNTISTTIERALSIVNTDIGVDDLTFQSISANLSGVGTRGIVLDNTGSAGNLVVTGSGGTCTIGNTAGCSGGTIAGAQGGDDSTTAPVGTGIVLRNTVAPSFTRIWINNATNYGIRGTNVTGLTLADSVVNGTLGTSAATTNKDGALRFEELTGTVNVTNTAVSGGYFTNVMVDNTAGVLNATFDNVDSLALDATGGDDAIQFEGIGTADMNVVYQNSSVTTASGDLFQYIGDGTGGGDLDLTGNTFTNNEPTINTGGGGLAIVAGAKGPATLDILNNTMRDSLTNALTVIKSQDVAAGTNNLVANISNNTIGVAGVANSGSAEGDGMEITTFGDGDATFNVNNNQVFQYNSSGIQFVAGSGLAGTGQFNLHVTGNTVANPGTNPSITLLQGIRVDSGVNVSDTYSTCVALGPNSITGSSDAANKDFRLVASQNTTVRQPGYAGGATDGVAFATYAASLIGGGAQGTAVANAPATFSGGGACP